MDRVVFTPSVQRHVSSPPVEVRSETVKEVLEQVFKQCPDVRGYVVDEQGVLRRHIAVFVDGLLLQDRHELSVPVAADAEVYAMQALSGG